MLTFRGLVIKSSVSTPYLETRDCGCSTVLDFCSKAIVNDTITVMIIMADIIMDNSRLFIILSYRFSYLFETVQRQIRLEIIHYSILIIELYSGRHVIRMMYYCSIMEIGSLFSES